MEAFGIPKDYYAIDLSIARGLDYYTGTVEYNGSQFQVVNGQVVF